jgi:hypothetical protein
MKETNKKDEQYKHKEIQKDGKRNTEEKKQ